MTNAQRIKLAITYAHVSEAELARRLGVSPQSFNQRLKTDKFSYDELVKIGEALGASYVSVFNFPDGTSF